MGLKRAGHPLSDLQRHCCAGDHPCASAQRDSPFVFHGRDRPVDENGVLYLGAGARVVAAPELMGWNLVAEELARAVSDGRRL